MHHLYILYSESKDRFYIGSTSSTPEERLKKTFDKSFRIHRCFERLENSLSEFNTINEIAF